MPYGCCLQFSQVQAWYALPLTARSFFFLDWLIIVSVPIAPFSDKLIIIGTVQVIFEQGLSEFPVYAIAKPSGIATIATISA